MRIIKDISEKIEDELDDAEEYVKLALREKESEPVVSDLFYSLAKEEMGHMNRLHDCVAKLIKTYREKEGEPPEPMMAVYNYLHEKFMKQASQIQWYLDKYSDR